MTLVTISIIIAACFFILYNIAALSIFGIPNSLSMTYYLYRDLTPKGNLKALFLFMMYIVVAFMMPAWITMSEGSNWQFLSFLAPASILFVGTAPAFKSSDLENMVHQVAAYLAAAFSIAWICLVTPFWWIVLIWLGLIALCSIMTSSYKSGLIYWLEMVAFCSTFTATIVHSLV